jgi:hypothetical protein
MRLRVFSLTILSGIFLCQFTFAQKEYPVAITKNGILIGKYKETIDTRNPIPVIISVDEARSIKALNVLWYDRNKQLYKFKIREFQLLVQEKNDTTIIKGRGEILNNEMLTRLSRINSGAFLYFEGIICEPAENESMANILLAFEIK